MLKVTPVIFLALGFTLGCTQGPLNRQLEAHLQAQKNDVLFLQSRSHSTVGVPIGWKEAFRRLESDNLSLIQSRKQLAEAKKATSRQWLGLVPQISAFASLGDSISELSDLSSDINFRLLANLTIPNPIEFYAGLYGAALQKQQAIWSHDLDRRRAYVQLCQEFMEAESLRGSEERLAIREKSLGSLPLQGIEKSLKSLVTEQQQLLRRKNYHRLAVNRLFNTPGANWALVGPVPGVSYRKKYKELAFGEKFGKLALNLQAVQIEGALLAVNRVRFRQWPSFSFGVSAPPLYSSDGESTDYSSDNLFLFSSVSKTIDYSDLGGTRSIGDAKDRLEFTRSQIRQRMESEVVRINDLKRLYENALKEERLMKQQIQGLRKSQAAGVETLVQDLKQIADYEARLEELQKQITQLDLQLLIWDENFWNR